MLHGKFINPLRLETDSRKTDWTALKQNLHWPRNEPVHTMGWNTHQDVADNRVRQRFHSQQIGWCKQKVFEGPFHGGAARTNTSRTGSNFVRTLSALILATGCSFSRNVFLLRHKRFFFYISIPLLKANICHRTRLARRRTRAPLSLVYDWLGGIGHEISFKTGKRVRRRSRFAWQRLEKLPGRSVRWKAHAERWLSLQTRDKSLW